MTAFNPDQDWDNQTPSCTVLEVLYHTWGCSPPTSTLIISRPSPVRVFVLNNCDNLLSRDAALRLGLVKRLDNINDLAFGEVGWPVQCDPIKIHLRDDATPYSISTARRIQPKVEQELQRMEENGVIERITEPTDWCALMVPVMKIGGGVRICVDLKKLNRAVKREGYMLPTLEDVMHKLLPTLEDVMHKLKGSTVFTKLDATSGFWQLPLDDATAKLTTFMTPFGQYFFRRLPFGISLAPEVFQRTMENILSDIEGVECYMDDILVTYSFTLMAWKSMTGVLTRHSTVLLRLDWNLTERNASSAKKRSAS